MASPVRSDLTAALRACRWQHAAHAAVCDVLEPWAHGTVVRASRYPDYRSFNLVRVEDEPRMSVDALVGLADLALDGLAHRRMDFDLIDAAEITEVYVAAQHRRAGYGTTLTLAAIADAGDVRDLWICADDEGSAKDLYARLGFRPVWTTMEFERLAVPRPCPAG